MTKPFVPAQGWGPGHRRGALTITFDNLGEAAEIETGRWDGSPVGNHYTAGFLATLNTALGPVRATYFVEGINATRYPEEIRGWCAAGNEVGLHAWQHESWAKCPAERRRTILADSLAAMRSIGVEPRGFRPPGGALPDGAWSEFEEAGLLYCSELGEAGAATVGKMVSLPFRWPDVDAYQLEPDLSFLRAHYGDPAAPFSIDVWLANLQSLVKEAVATGGQRTVIFHPHYLALAPEKLDAVKQLIGWASAQDLWIAPIGEVARFVAEQSAGVAALQSADDAQLAKVGE